MNSSKWRNMQLLTKTTRFYSINLSRFRQESGLQSSLHQNESAKCPSNLQVWLATFQSLTWDLYLTVSEVDPLDHRVLTSLSGSMRMKESKRKTTHSPKGYSRTTELFRRRSLMSLPKNIKPIKGTSKKSNTQAITSI